MPSRCVTIFLVPAVCLALSASRSAPKGYDLQPRFETGQELSVFGNWGLTFEVSDAQMQLGRDAMPDFMELDGEILIYTATDEVVLEASEGSLHKLWAKVTGDSFRLDGDFSLPFIDHAEPFSESLPSEILGHCFELTWEEDGEVEIVDVSADPNIGKLDATEAFDLVDVHHFEALLPLETVEVGDSWGMPAGTWELFQQEFTSTENGEEIPGELRELFSTFENHCSFEFTGTLISVEKGIATLHWSAEASLDSLDVVSIADVLRAMGILDELEYPLPDGLEATWSVTIELTGKGKFCLEAHQLIEVVFNGKYLLEFDGSVQNDTAQVEVELDIEGTIELKGGVEVQ